MAGCRFRARIVGREGSSAERGYFHDFVLKTEMGQPETATYETAVAEEAINLGRRGVGAYVEVLGRSAEQKVADTSTHE